MKSIGIIPSRYASTRFPGKPLAIINGKTMIQRVYEQAISATKLSHIVVATDDERIFKHIKEFGGNVLMTDVEHSNGTMRCNQVISILESEGKHFDIAINIQGDEPYINPKQIDSIISLFEKGSVQIATLAKKIMTEAELFNPNVVKVILDKNNKAIYFSRHPIPMIRDVDNSNWNDNFEFLKHIGIYGYQTNILNTIATIPMGKLERAEKLEQLRWIEDGISISVEITDFESIAIDTKDDLLKLETNY